MISPNQHNLKVHFAGSESLPFFYITKEAGINYSLFSAFPFVIGKMKNNTNKTISDVPQIIYNNSEHTIMDSGLFTLMFGSHAGLKDKTYLEKWMNLLVEFVISTGYKGSVVEVDCQKILGVDEAWDLRQKMKQLLPDNKMINVFHLEDGQKGLDKMIEYSDYIALSIPELRIFNKKDYTYQLTSYIKNKKPEIDIHLLGCTEVDMLRQCSFASSSDSTSWMSVTRFGNFSADDRTININELDKEMMIETYKPKVYDMIQKRGMNLSEKGLIKYSLLIFQAEVLKNKYSLYAGPQD